MTQNITRFSLLTACILFTALAIYLLQSPSHVFGSAPSGLPATVATTSNPAVSNTGITLFATSSCSARVITTYASPVMLTFSDYAGQTPTGTFGHLQAASTTVAYDSGQYGCGLVKVFSFAAQSITVTETR